MKRMAFILIISTALILCSCEKGFDPKLNEGVENYNLPDNTIKTLLANDYEITTKVFENIDDSRQIDISIKYPQIAGLEDVSLQNRINELIENSALKLYVDMEDSGFDDTEWPVNYSIVYADDKLFSVEFEGYINSRPSAHGTNLIYSVNIDLMQGQILNIDDLFDDTFKDKLNHTYFRCIDFEPENVDENAVNEVFDRFKDKFDASDDNFYLTADKFVILLPPSGYFRFASSYEDLEESMKGDHPIWQHILSGVNE